MNQLEQTIQTYIETLYAKGASNDYELAGLMKHYELAGLMKQVEEIASIYAELQQNTKLEINVISFYNNWMLDEIEVIKQDTLENSILILIHILDKLSERLKERH